MTIEKFITAFIHDKANIYILCTLAATVFIIGSMVTTDRGKLVLPIWSYTRIFYKPGRIYYSNGWWECVSEREYTKFGDWVKEVPGIVSLPILLPYYLIVWPIWAIYTLCNYALSAILRLLFAPVLKWD